MTNLNKILSYGNAWDSITKLASIYSGFKYLFPNHIKYIINKLHQLYKGEIKRLIINIPPQNGKSELISKYFTSFCFLNNPKIKLILGSYNTTYASEWCVKCRSIYNTYKSDLMIKRSNYIENIYNGYLKASGPGGPVTGKGADIFIIDDPIKTHTDAYSPTMRENVWNWYRSTAYSRLQPNSKIILIQTRWHYDDLTGRILENDKNHEWEVIKLKAIAEEDDVLGRQKGEALWPNRYSIEDLLDIKKNIGSVWFSALYQQEPTNSELNIIKREWWKYFDDNLEYDYIIQSWDTAFKTDVKNDFSVCTTIGIKDNYYYIFDVFVTKLEYPELEKVAVQLANKYKPSTILIEDKASGQSLLQYLKRFTFLPVKAIKPTADKTVRCHTAAPLFEQGKVFIKANEKWTFDVIEQFTTFPFGKHDDIVDSITQFINFAKDCSLTLNMRRL